MGQVQGTGDVGRVFVVLVIGLGEAAAEGQRLPRPGVGEGVGEEPWQDVLTRFRASGVEGGETGAVEPEDPVERAGAAVADLQEEGPVFLGQRHAVQVIRRRS
jgi:hypothetical protein